MRRILQLSVFALALTLTAPLALGAGRVTGGAPVDDSARTTQWGSIVAITSPAAKSERLGQYCAGTLIDDQHVLTAAHCVFGADEQFRYRYRVAPAALSVVRNTATLDGKRVVPARTSAVSTIFVHPMYQISSGRWDVAILRLAAPITDAPVIPLLTAETEAAIGIGSRVVEGARVAGWGDTDPRKETCCWPSRLQAVDIPIMDTAACEASGRRSKLTFYASEQICAGTLRTTNTLGADTCQGDSGGPLVVDHLGVTYLAGVTSQGVGCGEGAYGQYSRVSAFQRWFSELPGVLPTDQRPAAGGALDVGAPGPLTVRERGYRKVELSWSPTTVNAIHVHAYDVWVRYGKGVNAFDVRLDRTSRTRSVVQVDGARTANAFQFFVYPATRAGDGPPAVAKGGPNVDRAKPTAPRTAKAVKKGRFVTVTWGMSSDGKSGVAGYEVERKIGTRWSWAWGNEAKYRTARFTHSSGAGTIRVRAWDFAGNASAWVVAQ